MRSGWLERPVDGLATLVVSAIVSKGAQALSSAAADAFQRLVALVRRRLDHGTGAAVSLRGALEHPDDAEHRARLVVALADAIREDPAFAQELRDLYGAVAGEVSDRRDAVANQFSGRADTVIQARDIHGDLFL